MASLDPAEWGPLETGRMSPPQTGSAGQCCLPHHAGKLEGRSDMSPLDRFVLPNTLIEPQSPELLPPLKAGAVSPPPAWTFLRLHPLHKTERWASAFATGRCFFRGGLYPPPPPPD